ncbi:putative polyketide synthase [Hypoxylon crocopeplum]|nr:putative polyketide synthase [Hypoxylon crocopeplum]
MNNPFSTPSGSSTLYKKKLVFFSNEFPNDDLKDLFQRLHRHSKDRRFRSLAIFIEECTVTLKEEASKLPRQLQDLIPTFETVLSLADGDYRKGPLGAAMESVFLCVLQLGMIIGHYEGQDVAYDLLDCQSTLAGLSIGLLAGAAVSLSSSVEDLARVGAEAVRVAFRLGVYVDEISRKLESSNPEGNLQSWAYVVTGKTQEEVQKELDQYNTSTGNPDITKVFISAADKISVSVSGPPSRVKDAFQHSQSLRYSKSLPLPVYDGLCHASHLYSQDHIDFVINGSPSKLSSSRRVQLPLLSSRTGKPFNARIASEMFLEIGTELLTGTIYLDNVTSGVLGSIENSESPECEVALFRTTLISKGIMTAIAEEFPDVKVNRQDLIDWVFKDFGARIPRTPRESKLAIVGMACRMPGGANDTELYWQLMEQGRDVHTTVPEDRFDLKTHYDPTGKTENATQVPYGNFIDRPGFFDAGFFNMSPKEAEQTDPMHRLALVTAYEALEMAGYVPNRTPSTKLKRVGTYFGQASDDWRELNASQNIGTYAVPGGERAFANGRINYYFKFGGPSFNVDTACSSGLAAINAACSSLWSNEADTVIAGGLNIITDPDNYAGLGNGHFLSKTGQCKVWDKDADGYCRADGVGSVVIKRLEDAEADNDNILAVILSATTNHSAEAISITYPHAGAQKDNYTQVMHKAGVNPLDVSYVELHGTGTQAGDAVESESVSDVFAPLSPRRRPDQRLHLGAVKCNIGHGEAAAGIASLLKMLLIFQKNEIPPHIGIKTELNPTLPKDLDKRNVGLALSKTPWPKVPGKPRHAIVNSFGAHGGNTTVLLEDAPERQKVGEDERPAHVIAVSARSKDSLKANMRNLLTYLDENPDTDLGDLSYTTCNRRIHHPLRAATAVSSLGQLRKYLQSTVEGGFEVRAVPLEPPPVVFTFTGQGAFYRGIGRELFEDFPYFRSQVLQLDHIVKRLGFPSVLPVIDGSIGDDSCSPVVSQLSIVLIEIALAQFWTILGIQPDAVIGHSLGEYAALVVAGVISASDCFFLVGKRAEYLSQSCEEGSHVMLSVRTSADEVGKIVGDAVKYEVSCFNGHEDTVVSGSRDDIDTIRAALETKSIKCLQLDLPYAFHTAQIEPILDTFEKTASHISFKAPGIPVISPLLGSCIFDGKTINGNYLRRASREPVKFTDAIAAAQELGLVNDKTVWIDLGPHPVCGGLVRNLIPEARVVSSFRRNEDNIATIAKSLALLHLAGLPVCWQEYFRPHERAHRLVPLKKYSWNEKNYWIPYFGAWTLDKARAKDGGISKLPSIGGPSPLRTSLVHQVLSEEIHETTGKLQILSDMQQPDFLAALHGHRMNNCGVATSSIWSDMSFTVGEYLYKRVSPKTKEVHMNLANFEVLHAQVAKKAKSGVQQLIALEANLDLTKKSMSLAWYNVSSSTQTRAAEHFASCTVFFEDAAQWMKEWELVSHLVSSRISVLNSMAATGAATRLSHNMAYEVFKNVVDYAPAYRGMDSVVIHELEAVAEVTLSTDMHGTWHTPPFWIDSVSHIGGMVMNGSDVSNTRDFFYATPGCDSFRLARPLEAGAHYRSYVRMAPIPEAHMYAGDVYIFQDDVIVGKVGQIKFRRVPRMLMDQFFSPPKEEGDNQSAHASRPLPQSALAVAEAPTAPAPKQVAPAPATVQPEPAKNAPEPVAKESLPHPAPAPKSQDAAAAPETGVVGECLDLIARETGLERSEFTDEKTFVELGVDSLMSLVLSEKFRQELSLEIKSSLFLECPTIGELKGWLEQYC